MSHDILLILFCVTSHFSTWHVAVWNRGFEMNVFGLLRLAVSLWDHSVEELTESNSTNSPVGKGSTEILSLLGRTVYCWVEPEVIALVLFCFVLRYCLRCAGTWHLTSLVFQDWGKDSTRVQVSGIAGQLLWYAAEENAAQQKAHFGRCWEETQGCCKRLFFSLSLQCFFLLFPTIRFCTWSLVLILLGGRGGGMFRCVVVIAFQSLDCPIVRLHSYSLCADLFITYEQTTLCLALVVFTCSFLVLFSASIACDVMW